MVYHTYFQSNYVEHQRQEITQLFVQAWVHVAGNTETYHGI
jgi:hypothetical protein